MAQIIALLPLGAYEYHGQHLPYETDSLLAEAYPGSAASWPKISLTGHGQIR